MMSGNWSLCVLTIIFLFSSHGYRIIKRRPEMDTNGFYGDTFSSGFGDFYTARKRDVAQVYGVETPFSQAEKFYQGQPKLTGLTGWENSKYKRRMEMDTNGFYGDTFSSGFGDFYTAKRSKSLQNTIKSK